MCDGVHGCVVATSIPIPTRIFTGMGLQIRCDLLSRKKGEDRRSGLRNVEHFICLESCRA